MRWTDAILEWRAAMEGRAATSRPDGRVPARVPSPDSISNNGPKRRRQGAMAAETIANANHTTFLQLLEFRIIGSAGPRAVA
jgi:hypothetical protein